MKFKENAIKPGMVIHCPKEEDARALLKHLENIGYMWDDEFECKCGNQYAGWSYYGSDTCFGTGQDSKIIVWSRLQTWQKAGIVITEFSDLIEPEPRFKVGDKVRVRSDLKVSGEYGGMHLLKGRMSDCRGTSATIIGITDNDCYLLDNNAFNWPEEMLEPVDDSPINSPINSPMAAEEVLGWFKDNQYTGACEEIFHTTNAGYVIDTWSPKEIIEKITAYETAKKAPKPVEVEWIKLFRIIQIQDNGTKKCVYEEEVNPYVAYGAGEEGNYSFDPKYGAENLLKKYVSEHDGRYIAVIEDVCRVKEGES